MLVGERVRGAAAVGGEEGGEREGKWEKIGRERECVNIYVCVFWCYLWRNPPLQSPRIRERRKEEEDRRGGGGGGARTCPRALTAERAGLPLEIPNQRLFWILESNWSPRARGLFPPPRLSRWMDGVWHLNREEYYLSTGGRGGGGGGKSSEPDRWIYPCGFVFWGREIEWRRNWWINLTESRMRFPLLPRAPEWSNRLQCHLHLAAWWDVSREWGERN